MNILRLYISRSFYKTFFATVTVLTFIISIGGLFRITDLLARGIEPGPVLQVFLSGLPNGMIYAIPVSSLTAALLVFGRLSGDSEVTAMRACGISMVRVASWLFPFSLVASLLCVYLNSEMIPLQYYLRWRATSELRADSALSLLEVGRTVSLRDDLRLFVGAIQDDGTLKHIRIFDQRDPGGLREIKADRGVVSTDPETGTVYLALERVTIDPFQFDSPGAAYSERWKMQLAQDRRETYVQRDKHRNFHDLFVLSRELELQANRMEESDLLIQRARRLQQESYVEAETLRREAWYVQQRALEEANELRERAAEKEASGDPHAASLMGQADQVESEANAALERAEAAALAIERDAGAMVSLLLRQSLRMLEGIGEPEERLRERALDMRIILHQRVLLSFSPMLFLFFGIPMGIRPHRHETSVGIAASLVVMFAFYIVLTLFGEFKGHPQLRPDQLVWIPGVVMFLVDLVLLRRMR